MPVLRKSSVNKQKSMNKVPLGIAMLALASGLSFSSQFVCAQSDDGFQPEFSRALAIAVDYGNDAIFQPNKHDTAFEQLGMRPQQIVTITVTFPAEFAGAAIYAEPLDGGSVTGSEEGIFVGSDGTAVFQFQAGLWIGNSRISLHLSDDRNLINFWLVDTEHPENNPPGLPGVY
jgi:hypothetical protein